MANTPTASPTDTGTGPLSLSDGIAAYAAELAGKTPSAAVPHRAAEPSAPVPTNDPLTDDEDVVDTRGTAADEGEDFLDDDDGALPADDPLTEVSDEADPEDDDEEEITARTKRGKELTLTRRDLNNGLRHADYTRKTTEAAEVRKRASEELAATQSVRQQLEAIVEAQAKAEEAALPEMPSTELRNIDPGEYAARVADREVARERIVALRAARQQLRSEIDTAQQQQQQTMLKDEYAKLIEKVPRWKDPKVLERAATVIRRDISKFYGFTEAEVAAIPDHRVALVMRDALRYQQSVAKRDTIRPDPRPVVPVLRPGGKAVRVDAVAQQRASVFDRLNKSGSMNDGIAAMEMLLAPKPKTNRR